MYRSTVAIASWVPPEACYFAEGNPVVQTVIVEASFQIVKLIFAINPTPPATSRLPGEETITRFRLQRTTEKTYFLLI